MKLHRSCDMQLVFSLYTSLPMSAFIFTKIKWTSYSISDFLFLIYLKNYLLFQNTSLVLKSSFTLLVVQVRVYLPLFDDF